MTTAELLYPVLNDRTRSVNFFNGRLLSAEDLSAEQQSERERRALLGRAIGEGVVDGLEVEMDPKSHPLSPTLLVRAGTAMNARGDMLLLGDDVRLMLVPPAQPTPAGTINLFADCAPPQSGTYVSGEAVYLLTVCPAAASQGRARVSGLGNEAPACQAAYRAEGVRFRLVEVPVSALQLSQRDLLRNRMARLFLGLDEARSRVRDPMSSSAQMTGLIDVMRGDGRMTTCELPLAVLHWASGSGVMFADMYCVRRRTHRTTPTYLGLADDRQASSAEAFLLQFHDQIEFLRQRGQLRTARALRYFEVLPPAGLLPLASQARPDGAEFATFFDDVVYKPPTYVEGARLSGILRHVQGVLPLELASGELIRLHRVRENQRAIDTAGPAAARPYLLFVSGHAPDFSDPHYNVSRFDYSNYW